MKRLVRVLIVIVVLAVAVDFGAKLLVENLAAQALSSRRGVNGSVDVSFGGFPFLLALKDRHFGSVTIEAEDVRSGGFMTAAAPSPGTEARMESVRLELDEVTVSGQVWRDDADGRVSATSGGGSATLSQSALNKIVPPEHSAQLTLRDGSIRVVVDAGEFGTHEAEVAEEDVRLEAGAGSGTLIVEAASPVGALSIPLPTLVEGVVFEGVDVRRAALVLEFSVRDVNLEL